MSDMRGLSLKTIVAAMLMCLAIGAKAQCEMRNTAFKAGEHLTYNLYFNWNFIWYKVGTAEMQTTDTKHKGKDAYRCRLITRSNQKLDKHFIMRDTLVSLIDKKMLPQYYRKGAKEGKRYTVDEVWYDYHKKTSHIRMKRLNNDKTVSHNEKTTSQCVFDMLSLFLRSRSLDVSNWKAGHTIKADVASGKDISPGKIIYRGVETVKADNGKKYRCRKLDYLEWSSKKNKFERLATFFVTDDNQHIPVRLDFSLRFGSAKAYLISMKGTN